MIRILKAIAPLGLIGLGLAVAFLFMATRPSVTRQEPGKRARTVEAIPVRQTNATVEVEAMGTVVPSRAVTLRPQVSGRVVSLAEELTPGGRLAKGSTVLRIDPRDYEIALQKARSALARAEADLRLEQGRQELAREELAMFEQEADLPVAETDLVLRRPQLEQAQADVRSARADVARAELDLERTRITAPFNALVTERKINLGSQVGLQDELATLAATDAYWLQVTVPLDRLRFLGLSPEQPRPVRVLSQAGGGARSGRTLRLTGQVNESTRMAGLIIEVPDPLGLDTGEAPLMLGDYVRAIIQGRTLRNVFSLPRELLRDGGTVWVVRDNALDIRAVEPVWKDAERVCIAEGLKAGERIVTSEIPAPVQGMALEVLERVEAR